MYLVSRCNAGQFRLSNRNVLFDRLIFFLVTFSKIFFRSLLSKIFFLVTFSKSLLLLISVSGRWGDSCSTDGQFTLSRFLLYFLPYFSYKKIHTQTNFHTCHSGWQDIAFRQPPKILHIFVTCRDISFINLQHSSSSLCSAELLWQILFWEILISAQVGEGLCGVGLNEEGHSKCQHKQCTVHSAQCIAQHTNSAQQVPTQTLQLFLYICSQWPVTSRNPTFLVTYFILLLSFALILWLRLKMQK